MSQVKGKIVYIGPNDIYDELRVNFGKGDNINWQPEDLGISVDLQVIVADRDNCGKKAICDNFIFNVACNDAKEKYWQSFLNGENLSNDEKKEEKFLTTDYTDISYQEIVNNNAGGKESLGIQSIDISFDSHFFPIVKIKMIDVRGFSLMMPAEQAYVDKLNKKAEICNNFFSALFHFPYPRFALSVKGFYGDRVTFMLSVNDFQSSFNAQTGNFEVEIEFIGHMYGLYSDIPLNYLLVAPYMGADGSEVNQYWKNNTLPGGTFTFSDGLPIPTLVSFLEKYEKMAETFQSSYSFGDSDTQNIEEVTKIRSHQNLLNQVLSGYNGIINDIGKDNTITKISDDYYVLYFVKENSINLPSTSKLKDTVDSCNDEGGQSIQFPSSLEPSQWGFAKEVKPMMFIHHNDAYEINETHDYYNIVKNSVTLSNAIKGLPDEVKGRNTYLFKKEIDFVESVKSAIIEDDSKVSNLLKNSEKELREVTKKILGFVPTIENVFRMIYAHIDCFLTSFYELLSNIDSHKSRRVLSEIGGIDIKDTDVKADGTKNFNIPPFTGFYEKDEKNNRVRKYPGEILRLRTLDEVNYVEQLYSSVNSVKNKVKELSESTYEEVQTEPVETEKKIVWKPLSFIDLYYEENPYSYFALNDYNDFLGYLLYFYKVRVAGANIISNNNFANKQGKVNEDIIKNEAENAILELQNFFKNNESLKEQLKACSNDSAECEKQIKQFLSKNLRVINYFDEDGKIKLWRIEDFPFKFKNLKNNEKEIVFSSITGCNIIGENSDKDYKEFGGVKNKTDLLCEYSNNKKFHSGIYFKNGDKLGHINITDNVVKSIKKSYEGYYFPILQKDENTPKNLFKENFFNEELVNESGEINENLVYTKAVAFLASMVGDTDLYRFERDNSTLLRIPKFMALYFGGVIWNAKEEERINEKYPFWISSNGIYTGLKTGIRLKKLNGYSIEEFVAEDKNQVLLNYFSEWAKGEFVYLYNSIKDKIGKEVLETHKEITTDNNACFEFGGEVSNLLLDFYTNTVDIVKFTNRNIAFNSENLKSFSKYLYEYMEKEVSTAETTTTSSVDFSDSDSNALLVKNSIYYTLKNLYDKWISTYTVNTFKLKTPDEDKNIADKKANGEITDSEANVSEFDSFIFIDTFYNDIRDRFLVNPETIYKLVTSQVEAENNRSSLQFMTDIAQQNKLLFIALPVFNNFYDGLSIANIFTPQSLYDGSTKNSRGIGNTYALMYTHEPSHSLNNTRDSENSTDYDSDGFDIADSTGDIAPVAIESFKHAGYQIPAFGVTFAKQNQMYFKGLTLNMSNPRETDYSIYNRFQLAGQETNGVTNTPSPVGQNMFSLYSNRVYDCGVEMMGCANIMPMMYFQLNNVPMYKGAYRITNVKHHIENGSMTTSFSGTRISKNAIPFNQNVIDIESLINKINSGSNENTVDNPVTVGEVVAEGSGSIANSKEEKDFSGNTEDSITVKRNEKYSDVTFNVAKANTATRSEINKIIPFNTTNSSHLCATFTKKIVQAGFTGTVLDKYISGNAFDCRNIMPQLNFKPIEKISGFSTVNEWKTSKYAEPGDVAVMKHGTYGHICYFDGYRWISDFNQERCKYGLWPYSDDPKVVYIFRYAGNRIMPYDYHSAVIEIQGKEYSGKTGETIEIRDSEGIIKSPHTFMGEKVVINWTIKRTDKKAKKTKIEIEYKNGDMAYKEKIEPVLDKELPNICYMKYEKEGLPTSFTIRIS